MSHPSGWNRPFGRVDEPIGALRAADFPLRSPMGGWLTDAERDDAFRSFQFIGAVGPEMAVGCAITSTTGGISAFAYLWADGEFTELRLGSRADDVAVFAEDPDDGTTELSTSRGSVVMAADPTAGKRLTVESPALTIDLGFDEAESSSAADHGDGGAFETLRLCTPTGPTGWAYVQKVAAVPATGSASAGGVAVSLDDGALAHHDYTTGFLRPETWWHWACVAGTLPDGRRLGLNLSCGTNESGVRENGGWLDGRWFDLGGAVFDFDPDDTEGPWHVVGPDGDHDLRFTSDHGYHATGESPSLATNFHQLFGRFDGWVVADGERVELDGAPGFAESQYLRW